MKGKVFIFDFDGTLTKKDTLFPMAFFFLRKKRCIFYFSVYVYNYILFKLKFIENEDLKRSFSSMFFKGYSKKELISILVDFFSEKNYLNRIIFNEFEKLNISNQGNVLILSANFDAVIQAWILSKNIKNVTVIATQLSLVNDKYTGGIVGKVCRGKEKKVRLLEKLDLKNNYLVSYADEDSDKYIMDLASEKHWIGR